MLVKTIRYGQIKIVTSNFPNFFSLQKFGSLVDRHYVIINIDKNVSLVIIVNGL